MEKRVAQKEEAIDRKAEGLQRAIATGRAAKRRCKERETSIEAAARRPTHSSTSVRRKLEETAGLTRDEARRALVEQMTEEARGEAAKHIRQVESRGARGGRPRAEEDRLDRHRAAGG